MSWSGSLTAGVFAATAAGLVAGPVVATASRRAPPRPAHPALLTGTIAVGTAASAFLLDRSTLALVSIVTGTLGGGWWLRRRADARRAAEVRRALVVDMCEVLASELRAGRSPVAALDRVVPVWPAAAALAGAAHLGADVPAALRRLARLPGAESCAQLASAWQLSLRVGVGLAEAVDGVTDRARRELGTHRVIATELASAQATARMIAVLPVVVLVCSGGAGMGSVRFLVATPVGLACLAGGLGLILAGLAWIERIVAKAAEGS